VAAAILLLLALTGTSLRADQAEDKAVRSVEKLGGTVQRGEMVVGDFVVDVVTDVYLTGPRVTDAGLKELAALKTLQTLDLWGTKVTDVGLKELATLKTLQTLDLSDTQVTDVGLKELAALKTLQTLDLSGTQVTDMGKAELRKALPNCRVLRN